ncbi:hypothetical protein DFH07DRAFT_965511 [Mycena maculata]|uniref:Proteophosphoglycan ppg4 n=1 Tax=Mycena maculata TaxID=230809 RepID=A0AAD7IEH8_9AGAR|nr:hypothetical protein DFH07DRAFT_965511 [Mycena maculata]
MLGRRFTSWVLVAICLASMDRTVNGQPSPTITTSYRRHSQYNINYYYARQLMPSPLATSSYDYWWPYPPADATSPTATLAPTDTPLLSDASTPALAFSFVDSDSASVTSSSSDSLTSTSPSPSASSSSSSESVISISALPPSNSSVTVTAHRKLSMLPASNLVYIIPVCAVLGILVGGATTWCVYGCLTRNGHGRRRGRKSYGTLEVGPEYAPPSPRPEDKQELREEGRWVGDEKPVEESDGDDTARGDASDDDDERGAETAGFLHPGTAQTRPTSPAPNASTMSRARSGRSARAPSPTPSGRTSLFFDRADSTDALPWESLRHKSIKRGILARLRDDGDGAQRRPWQAHGRHDSDVLLADAQAALARAGSSATATSASASVSRAPSSVSRASTSATARTGPGFRILSESPAETPRSERGAEAFAWPGVEDRYTRVPARSRSRSPEKLARATSPEKFARGASPDKRARGRRTTANGQGGATSTRTRPRARDRDRDVLPQSPPRISSPVLDRALCFTPPPPEPEMGSFASFGAPTGRGE